jgi:hypothetical protein
MAIILCVTCATLPLYAQWFPRNFGADSSFRVEYLLGSQTLGGDNNMPLINNRSYPNPNPPPTNVSVSFPNPIEQLKVNFNNSLFVLDGVVELTPVPALSARVRGSVSVFNPDKSMTLVKGPVPNVVTNDPNAPAISWNELSSTIKPKFWLLEVAGLYNLSYEDVFRYSFVAGYRQESWSYLTSNDQGGNSYLNDDFTSQIPFIGLQTLMLYPSWKARFEVLGSPFMTKKISHTARNQGYYMQLDGNMTQGGFLEFQVEGNRNVAPNAWMGVYTQYTYEQLKGGLTGKSVDGFGNANYAPISYDFYTLRSIWILGLNCNISF